jgi:hypothetical protein
MPQGPAPLTAVLLFVTLTAGGCSAPPEGGAATDGASEAASGVAAAGRSPADGPAATPAAPTLEEVRDATARFHDVEVALAEGYVPDPMGMCETAENMGHPAHMGGMGIHYLRPDLLGITGAEPRVTGEGLHTDFLEPAVLLYEPQADGTLELVGVENLIFAEAWAAAGNTAPPHFGDVAWDYMEDDPATTVDEAHGFAPHYDLHLWVHRENPNGVYAPFNPAVSCAHHAPPGGGPGES